MVSMSAKNLKLGTSIMIRPGKLRSRRFHKIDRIETLSNGWIRVHAGGVQSDYPPDYEVQTNVWQGGLSMDGM